MYTILYGILSSDEKYKNLYNSLYFTSKEQYAISEGIENSFRDDFIRIDGTSISTGLLYSFI